MKFSGTPKRYSSYVPTGRIWPSGDFSVGYREVKGDGAGRLDLRSEARRIDDGDYQNLPDGWEYRGAGRVVQVYQGMTALERAECDRFHENVNDESGGGSPLTLAYLPNSHSPFWVGMVPRVAMVVPGWLALANVRFRPVRGRKGITGHGRKMVKSAATLIQRRFTARRTTFCTVSMPTLPQNLRVELARCWPEMLRQLLQTIGRQLVRQGLRPAIASVTEIQPKRLEGFGQAYLHLHLVWGNRMARNGNWALSALWIRAWCECFLKKRGIWVDGAWVRVNVQPVRSTAAGYLSKYMSKGSSEIESLANDLGWDAIPSQWWNLSGDARTWVKSELAEGDEVGHLLMATVNGIFSGAIPFSECLFCLSEVMMMIDGVPRGVGWRGAMRESYREDLLKLLDRELPMLAL